MKNTEQIIDRIADLGVKLAAARQKTKAAQTGPDHAVALQQQARLEGNIGALEWALREGN
jgi:hypothetical protein